MTDNGETVVCWLCGSVVNKSKAELHGGVWVCISCWQREHD